MGSECVPSGVVALIEGVFPGCAWKSVRKLGENGAGSSSYAVKVDEVNLFIKCLKDEDLEFRVYFTNEVVFYRDITRLFFEVGSDKAAMAKCLAVNDTCIVLEDLFSLGYQHLSVNESMTTETATLVLRSLGKFHALSFAVKELRRTDFQIVAENLREIESNNAVCAKMFTQGIHDALRLMKQALPSGSVYVEKLSLFTLNVYDNFIANLQKHEEIFAITHGDLWPNNILINEDKVAFVDFQGCKYTSIVYDLMLVLWVGLDQQTRCLSRNKLLQSYHEALCAKLQEFGVDPVQVFPYDSLLLQLQEHAKYALAIALVGLPLYLNQNRTFEAKTFTEYIQQVRANKSMQCKNKMIEIVMDAVDMGYL